MSNDTETLHCLGDGGAFDPCEGVIEYRPALPIRWRSSGALVQFPRCDKHYLAYCEANDEREEREERYRASLYCKHGTYVGDPYGPDYLCGACESE